VESKTAASVGRAVLPGPGLNGSRPNECFRYSTAGTGLRTFQYTASAQTLSWSCLSRARATPPGLVTPMHSCPASCRPPGACMESFCAFSSLSPCYTARLSTAKMSGRRQAAGDLQGVERLRQSQRRRRGGGSSRGSAVGCRLNGGVAVRRHWCPCTCEPPCLSPCRMNAKSQHQAQRW